MAMKKALASILVFVFGAILLQTPNFFAATPQGVVQLETTGPQDPLKEERSDPLTQQQLTEEEEEKQSVLPRMALIERLSFHYLFFHKEKSIEEVPPGIILPPPELA